MLELKKYQEYTVEEIERFCNALLSYSQGEAADLADIRAWKDMGKGEPYRERENPLSVNTPNICLKIPTGGGKTLLGIKSIQTIKRNFMQENTGLIVWIVPTKEIYRQTLKSLKDYDHHYRQELDRIAPNRRVKIKEKKDKIHESEVENDLVVLVMMLQSANRKNSEFLKMYQEDSKYQEFFPGSDDILAAREMLEAVGNLDVHKEGDYKISIKSSLGNVLKICRPLVIIDEAHKADSEIAIQTIDNMNPSFLLELTATPEKSSNVLVDISGVELKKEHMIKLPIDLITKNHTDWKDTIQESMKQLKKLSELAKVHKEETGQYIRPINVIRVERTGKKQEDKNYIHAETVKKYIIENMGYSEHEVRIKVSEKDEIGDENLLSEECPIKVIITKDALKEGWDCAFAYILTILDNTQSKRGLTQMLGRVLRQPYTSELKTEELNKAYVFCLNPNVGELVDAIEKSLKSEGLDGTQHMINRVTDENPVLFNYVSRREKYKGVDYLIPKVFIDDKGKARALDYERDILSMITWSKIQPPNPGLNSSSDTKFRRDEIDIGKRIKTEDKKVLTPETFTTEDIILDIAMNLTDIIPNAWQALRIGREFFKQLKGLDKDEIYKHRNYYLSDIRENVKRQVEDVAELEFKRKFQDKKIKFEFDAHESDWRIPEEMRKTVFQRDSLLKNHYGEEMQNSLFPEYEKHYNNFEKAVAIYIDGKHDLIECWHRVAQRSEFGIQGWRKYKIYPDFVVLRNQGSYVYLETKGSHLEENRDTKKKQELFNLLNGSHVEEVGTSKVSHRNGIKEIPLLLVMVNQSQGMAKVNQNIDKYL